MPAGPERLSSSPLPLAGAPVLAVCGFSGSGKTTLLEAAIPHLVARGLAVAVVKHDAHGFQVDKPGKDSDRLFRAGASMMLRGPAEQFQRRGGAACLSLEATLADLGRDHDLILVEGHKATPLPKLWIASEGAAQPPSEVTAVQAVLAWDSDRLNQFMSVVDGWLPGAWSQRPAYVVLPGSEFRLAKLDVAGSLMESAISLPLSPDLVALAGAGRSQSRLLACLLTGHRWAPAAAWMVAPADAVLREQAPLATMLEQRRPGIWALFKQDKENDTHPSWALYEPQALTRIERLLLAGGEGDLPLGDLLADSRAAFLF